MMATGQDELQRVQVNPQMKRTALSVYKHSATKDIFSYLKMAMMMDRSMTLVTISSVTSKMGANDLTVTFSGRVPFAVDLHQYG